jgi:two-component system sensor histidine kinase DegS
MQIKRSVFTLSITDDGKGFDVKILESKGNRTGIGLIGIRERAASLNGDMKIESSLGHGTTLLISLPVKGTVNG